MAALVEPTWPSRNRRGSVLVFDRFRGPAIDAIELISELSEQERYLHQVRMEAMKQPGQQCSLLPMASDCSANR